MIDLSHIIQSECIPRRNCLLSVTDASGDTGFLYFKDSQLIEANHGTVWSQQAFTVISKWQIESYSLNELPVGIKRTLWEPIDKMIEDAFGGVSASDIRDSFKNLPPSMQQSSAPASQPKSETQRIAFTKLYELPGFLALFMEIKNEIKAINIDQSKPHPNAKWLSQIQDQCNALSKALGTGNLRSMFLKTDSFCGWRIAMGNDALFLFADPYVDVESFGNSVQEVLSPLL